MPVELSPKIILSDDDVLRIAAAVVGQQAAPVAAPPLKEGERYLDVEFPTWVEVETREGVSYTWPKGDDDYDPFTVYEGTTSLGSIRLAIGWCDRTNTWGRDRRYAITFYITEGGKRPLCEFLASDHVEQTGEYVAIIRGAGAQQRSMYDLSMVLPSPYRHLRTENYRDHIDYAGSWSKQAVVAREDDVETMMNHSLIQAQLRFNINPS